MNITSLFKTYGIEDSETVAWVAFAIAMHYLTLDDKDIESLLCSCRTYLGLNINIAYVIDKINCIDTVQLISHIATIPHETVQVNDQITSMRMSNYLSKYEIVAINENIAIDMKKH